MYWILLFLTAINSYNFKRVALLPIGLYGGDDWIVGKDMDHNGLEEIIFEQPGKWVIWEYREVNQYESVYTLTLRDTSLSIMDAGDGDRDGLSEICGRLLVESESIGIKSMGAGVFESQDSHSFPSILIWYGGYAGPRKFTDLDDDGKEEIFSLWYDSLSLTITVKGIKIYENDGNNSYKLIYTNNQNYLGYCASVYLFGDFDRNGKKGWFELSRTGDTVIIWESVGDNRYEPVWGDHYHWENVYDSWLGDDTDGDGMPEIFIKSYFYSPTTSILSMYEATGDNTYKLTVIDTIKGGNPLEGTSACGDVDGDGREEVIMSIGTKIFVYKAIGDNKYERVWEWWNDMGEYHDVAYVACHDFNKNGYDEIIVTGGGKTSIFEIDTTHGIASKTPHPLTPELRISPNPVKGIVDIRYEIPDRSPISLKVYDASGRLVKTLVRPRSQEPRVYKLKWDGKDSRGKSLPPGIYFCEFRTEDHRLTRKLIWIRRHSAR